ncbi:hypothetical protein [Weissella diestrammenae]|uniref:hypothetical protein n=1 Tax=Weissella diestrammenae TaxID=1162633 RepID=UPI001FAC6BD2|nr:hypothetical protein [Weissella diestrammenae]
MKAYIIPTKGETLTLSEQPVPTPSVDLILVKVKAIGLNPLDYKLSEYGND